MTPSTVNGDGHHWLKHPEPTLPSGLGRCPQNHTYFRRSPCATRSTNSSTDRGPPSTGTGGLPSAETESPTPFVFMPRILAPATDSPADLGN
ncbi:hypothetical protein ACWEWX_10630 [Streptomyces asiaticus]